MRQMRPMSREDRLPQRYAAPMADEKDRELRVSLQPLTGEEALRALLAVDPNSEPVQAEEEPGEADAPGESEETTEGDDRCPVEGWGVNEVQRCVHRVGHVERGEGPHLFIPGR